MDDSRLKHILTEQKTPLADAVQRKIAYLKSDEVFTEEASEWSTVGMDFAAAFQSGGDSFADAFKMSGEQTGSQNVSFQIETAKVPQSALSQPTVSQPVVNQPTVRKPMTMAERIAALRGVVSVSQDFGSYRK